MSGKVYDLAPDEPDRVFRCGTAARWLPRALGATVLIATMLGALRVDADVNPMLPHVQRFVILAGAMLALVTVRRGSEVRREYGLAGPCLIVSFGAHRSRLELDDIDRLDYAAPFARSTHWIAAAVLVDRDGRIWRIPALLDGGDELLRELLERSGRSDLGAWADAYRVVPRMSRARMHVRAGYGVVVALLVAALVYYLR